MPSFLRDPARLYFALRLATGFVMAATFTTSAIYRINVGHLSPFQLVLVGTVLELSVFLFEIPTGVVADSYSRRASLIIGFAIIGVGFAFEGAIARVETILLAQVIWALGYTFTSGATEAWLMDEAGEARGEHALIRSAQFAPLGSLLGIGCGAGLAALNLRIPYFVGGAGMVLISLALLAAMRETNFTPAPRSERGNFHTAWTTFRNGLGVVRGRHVLILIMLISVGQGLWSEAFDRLWELQFLQHFAFPFRADLNPVIWFGIINAIGLILGIGVIEVVRRVIRGRDATVLAASLGLSTAAMGVGLATFALAGSFALGVGSYLTVRIIYRMLDPLLVAWLNRGLERHVRATVISMYGQMNAFGQVTGGPVVGLIGSLAGVRAALFVSSLVLIPVVGLYGLATRASRRELDNATTDPGTEASASP